MNVRTHASLAAVLLVGQVASCSGTETQNPLKLDRFVDSGCKKETTSPLSSKSVRTTAPAPEGSAAIAPRVSSVSSDGRALLADEYAASTQGLQCVAWQVADGRGQFALLNFAEACGAKWTGSAQVDRGTLVLGLGNAGCQRAACGWCTYDWSFEVAFVASDAPLPVRIEVDSCPGTEPVVREPLTLPLPTQPKGIVCRPANWNALGWHAIAKDECGTIGMPCQGSGMCGLSNGSQGADPPTLQCREGLVCNTSDRPNEPTCAKPCTTDGECGIHACVGGLCRPRATW